MMDISIFYHWIPDLKQINSFTYTSAICPICLDRHGKNHFRVNTKLKVFKCYCCGSSGKDINKFIKLLKASKNKYPNKTVIIFDVQLDLPF